MKKHHIPLLFLLIVLCSACGKTADKEGTRQENTSDMADMNVIHRLPDLHVEDTVISGSNVYVWTIDRVSCDSIGIVKDEMGYRFADNLLSITIRKNGSPFFSRTFKKSSFSHLLDEDFARQSILDGCRFLQVHEGMLTFSLAVSYPESDMSRPFKLNIGPDGSFMILEDNDLEEEYSPEAQDE